MTNWFERVVLGRKGGKPRRKIKLDKWFMLFLAVLLWSLASTLFDYAIGLPYNLSNFTYWLRMLAVVVALFGWVWLFKIYVASVRDKGNKGKEDEPK